MEKNELALTHSIVAKKGGNEVGWAFLDTTFPPYAEISGFLVNPKYEEEMFDIGSELLVKCITLAEKCRCNVIYTIEWKNGPASRRYYELFGFAAHLLYKKYGFQPAMINNFDDNDYDICLFRFSDAQCYEEYISKHPLSILSISGGKTDFHAGKAYEMKWTDPQTKDFLAFYLEGNRSKSRPRIVGIARKEKAMAFEAWINQTTNNITSMREGEFEVCLQNTGKEKLDYSIDMQHVNGLTQRDVPTVVSSKLYPGKKESWIQQFSIDPGVKMISNKILTTCQVRFDKYASVYYVSGEFALTSEK